MYCQALIVNHYELPVILNGLHRETAHAVHSAHSAHGELRELAFFAALKSHLLHHLLHTFVVDIRSNECYSNEELFKEISARLKSEAKARSFRLNSSHISAEHPFVKRAVKLGRVPFGSPTLSDQALMKFPSVKIGPGKSSRSHTADEYIMVSEIEEAIRLYIEMLDGLVL